MINKINKLTLPATILIASIIIGGFYYASQVSKQKSIERQQQIEIQEKAKVEQAEKMKDLYKQQDLYNCLERAETAYWAYMKLNGTEKADGTINAYTSVWDTAKKDKQTAIDNCYKQYK